MPWTPPTRYDKSVLDSKTQQAIGALRNLALDVVGADDPAGAMMGTVGPLAPLGMAASKVINKSSDPAIFVLRNLLKQGPDETPDAARMFLGEMQRGTPKIPEIPPIIAPSGFRIPPEAGIRSRSPALQELRAVQQHWQATAGTKPRVAGRPAQADRPLHQTVSRRHTSSQSARSKLSEEQVQEIRQLKTEGIPTKQIATKLGINHNTVNEIVQGIAYRRVK